MLEGIRAAELRAGREKGSVRLVAVSKTYPAEAAREAVAAGAAILGENRVQEALAKMAEVGLPADSSVEWHLIGTLQKNKARQAVGAFALIHSVDSVELAREIDRQAKKKGITQRVLFEVNIASEESKHGFGPDEVVGAAVEAAKLSNIAIDGLMCVPPITDDPEDSRPYFIKLRALLAEMNVQGVTGRELSMGMTQDYPVAVEEGATFVRVGTAIFGARNYG
ncbi:MAG TPA: YggS family pyridoxal phosphate-dependent enzyme [Nitrospirota bacterium]